jgi:hypothetical protein
MWTIGLDSNGRRGRLNDRRAPAAFVRGVSYGWCLSRRPTTIMAPPRQWTVAERVARISDGRCVSRAVADREDQHR